MSSASVRKTPHWLLLVIGLVASSGLQAEIPWELKADYVDACSCDLTCPCLFDQPSTHCYCKGATLVDDTNERPALDRSAAFEVIE